MCVVEPSVIGDTNDLPRREFQCLISNYLPDPHDEIEIQYVNSMMYIYDYDETSGHLMTIPRNLLPYAILQFQMEDPNTHDPLIYAKQIPKHLLHTNSHQSDLSLSISFNDSDTSLVDTPPLLSTFQTTTSSTPSTDSRQKQFELISKPKPAVKKKFSFSKKPAPEPQHSAACQLNPYFQPVTPQDDKTPVRMASQLETLLSRRSSVTYENLPRWREVYEKTGVRNITFRAKYKMIVRLKDIRKKFKFKDEAKTCVDMSDPVNRHYEVDKKLRIDKSSKVKTKVQENKSQEIKVKTQFQEGSSSVKDVKVKENKKKRVL